MTELAERLGVSSYGFYTWIKRCSHAFVPDYRVCFNPLDNPLEAARAVG